MKMTNAQMADSLDAIMGTNETGILGFALAKNYRKLLAEAQEYLAERDKLFEKYGQRGEKGVSIPMESVPAFIEELSPFATLETDVDVMTVPQSVFISGSLTTRQMVALDWMVEGG